MACKHAFVPLHVGAAALAILATARAHAQPPPTLDAADAANACVAAFEGVQSDRMNGRFLAARARLPACSATVCPTRVRDECARMRDELDRATPSATFAVRDADGSDLEATLAVDGTPFDIRAGRAQLLDPGTHVVTYTLAGENLETTKVTIFEGEKTRLVVITPSRRLLAAAPRRDAGTRSLVVPAIIGGAGVVLAVTAVIFAGRAIGSANEAAALAPNVPRGVKPCEDHSFGKADESFCSAAEDTKTSGAVAVTTGVAGTLALGTAIVMTILELRRPQRPSASAARLAPTVGPNGAGAAFNLTF